jgi:hypothetical protein
MTGDIGVVGTEQLIQALLACLVASLLGAILLRAASEWVTKTEVPFRMAYWTECVYCVVYVVLGLALCTVIGVMGSTEAVRILEIVLLPVGFVLHSGIVSWKLNISFVKASLVSLTMMGTALGIGFVVGVLILLVW